MTFLLFIHVEAINVHQWSKCIVILFVHPYAICEPWIEFNNLLSYNSITFFGNDDLNPCKPPSNNY
jgi:hypothetical protein